MAFITGSDETATMEFTLFPKTFNFGWLMNINLSLY
jgi:hypothetical protein